MIVYFNFILVICTILCIIKCVLSGWKIYWSLVLYLAVQLTSCKNSASNCIKFVNINCLYLGHACMLEICIHPHV